MHIFGRFGGVEKRKMKPLQCTFQWLFLLCLFFYCVFYAVGKNDSSMTVIRIILFLHLHNMTCIQHNVGSES